MVIGGYVVENESIIMLLHPDWSTHFTPLTAKLSNSNFYSIEFVSDWRDPYLQVHVTIIKIRQNGGQWLVNAADWRQLYLSSIGDI